MESDRHTFLLIFMNRLNVHEDDSGGARSLYGSEQLEYGRNSMIAHKSRILQGAYTETDLYWSIGRECGRTCTRCACLHQRGRVPVHAGSWA